MTGNKLILKNSLILYVKLIITSILAILTTRIVIKALGVDDFGLYNIVGGVVALMAYVNTVMITATYRFIAYEQGKGNLNGLNAIFNVSLVIHIGIAMLVVVLAETIGRYYIFSYLNYSSGSLVDALIVFRLSVLAVVFTIISVPYQGLITAQEKFAVKSYIEIFRSIIVLMVAYTVLFYDGN